MTGDQLSIHGEQEEKGPSRTQVRLLAVGGGLGAVALAVSLAVGLSGHEGVSQPTFATPSLQLPSDFPTDMPSLTLPSDLPTELPELPELPGGDS